MTNKIKIKADGMPTIEEQEAKTVEQSNNLVAQDDEDRDIDLYDPGDDAGLGLEGISLDEQKLPFLRILDPKSPQCKPTSQGGIPGARGGALFNTATNQVYDGEKGGEFIPSFRDYKFVEYISRNEDGSGGGFRGLHDPENPKIQKLREQHGKFGKIPFGETANHEPLELVQTFYIYGTFYPPGEDEPFPCIVGFASTQIKKYQAWLSRVMRWKAKGRDAQGRIVDKPVPMWQYRWHLSSQYESKGGFNWYGWVLELAEKDENGKEKPREFSRLAKDDPRYLAAREFFFQIKDGMIKPDYEKAASDLDPDEPRAAPPRSNPPDRTDEEIPY